MSKTISKFTLDTNCLISVDDNRPERTAVLALIEAARHDKANVAMVASSASERQIGGGYLSDFSLFVKRLSELGFDKLELLKPIGAFDVSFYGHSIYPTTEQIELQKSIFSTLFPTVNPSWSSHAGTLGLNRETDFVTPEGWKWRNKLLDVQAMWAHLNYKRDVFVTSDRNFSDRFGRSSDFNHVIILDPEAAVRLL